MFHICPKKKQSHNAKFYRETERDTKTRGVVSLSSAIIAIHIQRLNSTVIQFWELCVDTIRQDRIHCELNRHQTAPGDPFTLTRASQWQFILLSSYYSAVCIKPQADKWEFHITSVCPVSSARVQHTSLHITLISFTFYLLRTPT